MNALIGKEVSGRRMERIVSFLSFDKRYQTNRIRNIDIGRVCSTYVVEIERERSMQKCLSENLNGKF